MNLEKYFLLLPATEDKGSIIVPVYIFLVSSVSVCVHVLVCTFSKIS